MEHQLQFEKIEAVRKGTWICQVDDGTIFYWKYTSPKRLFVKWNGNELTAGLPEDEMYCKGAYGNAIYMSSKEKIYKAVFAPSIGISVSFLRDQLEGEELHYGGLCSRVRDGKTFVYRMGDDPEREGVLVNVPDERLDQIELRLLHRGKAIYVSKNSDASSPSVNKVKENVIVVEMRYEYSVYARDSSPFIYIAGRNALYTLDTITMEFLPVLRTMNSMEFHSIAGIHDGVITVDAMQGNDLNMMRARLPEEYIENTVTLNGETMTIEALVERHKDLNNTIADLQKIISDLIKEKDNIKRIDEELMANLKLQIRQHQSRNFNIEEKMGRIQHSTEEKTKMSKTIVELREQNSKLAAEMVDAEQLKVEISEIQTKCLEHSHHVERLKQSHLEENAKLQRINMEVTLNQELMQKAHLEEKEKLNKKIEELKEELSEKEALDNVESARAELNMKRLTDKINELASENRNQAQKFKEECDQLNLIIELQNENMVKEMKTTEEAIESNRVKDEELEKIQRQLTELSLEKDRMQKDFDDEKSELRKKNSDLIEEKERMLNANAEEITIMKDKIDELQEELSDLVHEKDALDKVERSRAELNLRRLADRINELTSENRNQAQKFKEEADQLCMIIDLQNKNLAHEMKMTEEASERQKIKDEKNDKLVFELRERIHELENSRMHKISVTAAEEDDEIRDAQKFLAELKQQDSPEEINETIVAEERPSLGLEQIKDNSEPTMKLSSQIMLDQAEAEEKSPVPNDPRRLLLLLLLRLPPPLPFPHHLPLHIHLSPSTPWRSLHSYHPIHSIPILQEVPTPLRSHLLKPGQI